MLDVQRLRQGQLKLSPTVVELRSFMAAILTQHQRVTNVPLRLKVSTLHPSHLWILVDGVRLRQLVTNGLFNAIKHTDAGEITLAISIEVGRQAEERLERARDILDQRERQQLSSSVSCAPTPDADTAAATPLPMNAPPDAACLVVRIRDTGPGLRGLDVNELFRPFVSVPESASRATPQKLHSSGLGLSICAMIARCMHGGVDLYDAGNGCVFEVVLPVELRGEPAKTAEGPPAPRRLEASSSGADSVAGAPAGATAATGGARMSGLNQLGLVVVDDQVTNVKIIRRMLQGLDITLEGVSSGDFQEATALAVQSVLEARSTPIVVLLDRNLGAGGSGDDVLKAIRRRYSEEVRVVGLTGDASPTDVQRMKSLGYDGLIGKPVTSWKLTTALQRVMGLEDEEGEGPWLP